jgi:hypothetical protein
VALVGLMAFAAAGALAKPQVTEHYASFGPDGTESTDFERINGVAYDQQSAVVYVLDGKAGTLSKFDQDGTPLPFTGTAPYIEDGVIEGISVSVGGGFGGRLNESQVAVDSTSHVVYVTEEHSTRAFQADGEAAKFSAGPGKDTSEIPGFGRATGVCVDVNGAIYVSDESADTVSIFASSGALIKTFEAIRPGNVAVASGGALYVASTTGEEEEGVRKFTPSEFPVTTSTTYGASPPLEKTSGRFTVGVGVDPANGEAYVLETNLDDAWIKKFDSAGNLLRYFGGPEEEEERLGGYAQGVAVVAGGEEFQFYVGDTERGSYSKVAIYGEEITEGPPAIKSTSVIDVTADSATLRAQVNPNTAQTTYRFEYGPEDCAISACASVPLGGGLIPAGHVAVPVSQAIFSLDPATTYHYRIVAENSFDPPTEGPDRTFTTQVSGLGFQLSDSRAWEMVTPSDKHGSTLAGISAGHLQASAEGNGLAYLGRSPFEAEPEGNRGLEAMSTLARRGADGWHSKDITPPHEFAAGLATGNSSEYKMFSPDLSRAALDPRSTTLFSPEASERAPYLRENTEPATYTPLVTGKEGFANVPPGTEFGGLQSSAVGPVKVAGGTPDLSHVVVSSEVPLAAGAAIGALYEWVDGQLHPLSALPASEGGAIVAASSIGTNFKVVRNAISDDGSRVFWTASHLYMRDTVAEETTRLDLVQGGSGSGNAEPVYQGASADGSVAFFTDSQQLTDDASPEGRDLYRCELPLGGVPSECATLTDISAPAEGSGESAEVQGIASALSEDATKIYFVAKGALDPTPNSLGDVAVAKQPNLYIWQEGEGTRFIATLAKNDSNDWGSALGREKELNANGSPGGRYLSFMSERSLTGQDNLDAVSGKPVEQVFSYDAVADELLCISCNPSGALPHGERVGDLTQAVPVVDPWGLWENRFLAANLPQASAAALAGPVLYRPRAIFDNGRVFFHSFDALVPADSNGNWDVYEYEPTGVGDCTASSAGPSIARSGEGCVSLVSSGTAEGQSGFLDASESGNDVFFTTTAKLSVLDTDEERDIYDARVGGVVAKLTPRTECQGETCLPAPNPPNDPTPASASFRGAGNVASERCPASKRKVTRNGNSRCVSRKKQHKRKHRAAKRANSNHGRAAR